MKLISRDPQKQALEAFARSKSWLKAAQLAVDLGDEEKMVRYSLMAALGRVPADLENVAPQQAALHLAAAGHHRLAAPLFAYGGDLLNAGRSCSAAKLHDQAASYLERAGAWQEVVRCYQEMGRPTEALRSLDRWERALEREADEEEGERPRPRPSTDDLRLLRAELLLRLGRTDTAANLLRSLPASSRRAELLERAGKSIEAVQGYLAVGDNDSAHRLNATVSDRDRDLLLVKVHMRDGRPNEAGHLLARMGLAREAAEAYEAGGQWGYAGGRWEAAGEPKLAAQCYEKAGQWARAGRCWATAGMPAEAAEAYVRGGDLTAATDLHVRAGRLLEAASLFLSKGHPAKAAAILMRVGPADPTYALATLLLVPLLIDEGFAADALERLGRIRGDDTTLDGKAGRVERVYWQGRALEALGRNADAQPCYAHVLDHDPGYRDALARLERLRPRPVASESTSSEPPAAKQEVLAVGGRVAGRYDIEAELGRGGMGRVFRAHDLELGETVAIKGLVGVSDGGFGEEARLLQELQICRRISHPNVVRVFDLGRFPGGIFLTMEFLEGRRLDQMVVEDSPLSFATIRNQVAEIAAGLREAHALGIVHRDLKPSNIMITSTRLKILDFGIAAMAGAQARLTQAGFVMGSPMFMSPDQLQGLALDGRSDLYSLGLLTYCMITGREPFAGLEPHAVVLKQLRSSPPPMRTFRADTPERWVAFVDRLLAKNRDDRYRTADEVIAALADLPVASLAAAGGSESGVTGAAGVSGGSPA